MIDAAKRFQGGRPYYHYYLPSPTDIPVNPDWPQRLAMMRREKRHRVVRIVGIGVLYAGMLVGAFWMVGL